MTSIKGLKSENVILVKDSYLSNLASNGGVSFKSYKNTDELLRRVSNDSVVLLDRETYDYYKVKKFSDFNELYRETLPYKYSFYIRDVNKNEVFAKMFLYYVETIDYNSVKFVYNTNINNYSSSSLMTFLITLFAMMLVIFFGYFVWKRKKNKKIISNNNDKLKYIDVMTSLKNRNYLNLKMKEWDDNTTYPQSFIIVDLNNIKYINDHAGHEEGDMVIKKAASILIAIQEANTDIVRTDGNEFLVYMVGYDEQDVVNYTRRIYKELKALPYGYGASVGYSMIFDDVKTVDDAINEATIDMRNRKEQMMGDKN